MRAVGLLTALVLSAACSDAHSTLEIRAHASLTDPEGIAGIRLRIDSTPYDASDFMTVEGVPKIVVDVPNRGDLQIAVALTQEGAVVAQGSLTIEMAEDFEWGLGVFRQVEDPADACFGCRGSERVPIAEAARTSADEAIWLVWSGDRRGSDIVY